jgi:hypothetical protein
MRLIPLILVLSAAFHVSAAPSGSESDREYLEARLGKFKSMRTTGFVLAGIGVASLVGGIALASNGEYETVETPTGTQTQAQDGAAAGGLLLIIAGIPVTVAGIVLGSIGSSKVQKYKALLEGVSLDLRPGHTGARLSYKF